MLITKDVEAAKQRLAELMSARAVKAQADDEPLIVSAQVAREIAPLVRETLAGQGRGAQTTLVNDALSQYFGLDAAGNGDGEATVKVRLHRALSKRVRQARRSGTSTDTVINDALAQYFDIQIAK